MSTSHETHKDLTCIRLASDGSGVCLDEGRTTFVPGLLPGENGLVTIFEVKKRWQRGRLVQLLHVSPNRVDPPCRVFPECGGCQLQHLEYAETLRWKRQWVIDALKRIGRIAVPVKAPVGMDFPWRYRNKARLHRDQAGNLGYYRQGSNNTIEFTDCLLLSEQMNGWIRGLRELGQNGLNIPTVTVRANSLGQGLLLFESFQTLDSFQAMVSSGTPLLNKRKLPKLSLYGSWENGILESGDINKFLPAGVTSVWISLPDQNTRLIGGDAVFREQIFGLNFQVSPTAFFQVNHTQMEALYSIVLEWADLNGVEQVWDLYCGVGTLTLALARRAGHVLGIETNARAIKDAEINAELNRITNVRFRAGQVERILPSLSESPDLVVLDPPRAGLHPAVIKVLLNVMPSRLIYVSCDPGTLARDLGLLVQGGYHISQVQPVDMFPWTQHVETVVLMSRVEK